MKALPSRRKDLEPVSPLRLTASFLWKGAQTGRVCSSKVYSTVVRLAVDEHTSPPPRTFM